MENSEKRDEIDKNKIRKWKSEEEEQTVRGIWKEA